MIDVHVPLLPRKVQRLSAKLHGNYFNGDLTSREVRPSCAVQVGIVGYSNVTFLIDIFCLMFVAKTYYVDSSKKKPTARVLRYETDVRCLPLEL